MKHNERDLALWAVVEKIAVVKAARDSRAEHLKILAAITEACWWIASLDEELRDAHGTAYDSAREGDPQGRVIPGLRWARHRHSHDLVITPDGDVRPFLSDEPGTMLFISTPYRWRPISSMNLSGKSATANLHEQRRYRERMENQRVELALSDALGWLTRASAQPVGVDGSWPSADTL
ncbi:hypothetical protein ACTJJ4_07765 [Microbacterium sp. 22195]|uniref:hypothetical protein n=1 Tax=Microbacterium sp. 22195 TaxID=3453891 RepID=UPI003F87BCD0